MKSLLRCLALAALAALAAPAAMAGTAVVKFTNPDDYTDIPYSERQTILDQISAHFSKQVKSLPAGVTLNVEVLDIDLAGEVRPNFRNPNDIRVLKGRGDGPVMKVRYSLTENGKELLKGEETLTDVRYLQRSNRHYGDEELRYEKQMIDDWLRERFGVQLTL